MALAYILCGIAAGGSAALLWLGTGGSLIGALAAYTLAGQIAVLSLLWQQMRGRDAD